MKTLAERNKAISALELAADYLRLLPADHIKTLEFHCRKNDEDSVDLLIEEGKPPQEIHEKIRHGRTLEITISYMGDDLRD